MAGYLTTHVLDAARGCPAAGMAVALYRIEGEERVPLARMTTNADGRTDAPILPEDAFAPGIYELVFQAGDYLDAIGAPGERPRFLDVLPIRFGLAEPTHYHVPLLLSPYSFSTYRGS
jgi:5-hydroxyisourate hydrolase